MRSKIQITPPMCHLMRQSLSMEISCKKSPGLLYKQKGGRPGLNMPWSCQLMKRWREYQNCSKLMLRCFSQVMIPSTTCHNPSCGTVAKFTAKKLTKCPPRPLLIDTASLQKFTICTRIWIKARWTIPLPCERWCSCRREWCGERERQSYAGQVLLCWQWLRRKWNIVNLKLKKVTLNAYPAVTRLSFNW